MPDPHDFEHDLRRHAVALRSIARDLLRDPDAADDVVQDTLHQALVQQNLRPGPLGGWLYRTLVNFTRQRHRSDRRRALRHARLQPRDPVAAPPDAISRRETLQAVTDAVLLLDEPYQTAIFLRYFADLPPRAIARATGANVATVKSRLQRGLAMLRARLDRAHGRDDRQWRLALLSTFSLPASLAAGFTATGAWIMGTTTKSLLAAGALCVGGLFLYGLAPDAPPVQPASAATDAGEARATAARHDDPRAVAPMRESVPFAEEQLRWLDHPFTLELEVHVVDPTGLPVQGHTLRLAPPGCPLVDGPSTGPDGVAVVSWRSRVASEEMVIADERGTLRRLAVQHGRKATLTLAGGRAGQGLRLSYATSSTIRVEASQQLLAGVPIVNTLFRGDASSRNALRTGLHPHALFGASTARVAARAIGTAVSVSGRSLSLSELVIEGSPRQPDTAADAAPPRTRIAGTVFGEDGKPAGKTPVVLLGSGHQPLHRAETDDAGQFAFPDLVAAEFTVRAGGNHAGLATVPAITTTGTTPVTLNLQRGSCIRGKAFSATGEPLANATVSWRAADGSWCDSTESDEAGRFVLANLPGTAGSVLLWGPGNRRGLPLTIVTNVLCDTGELLLRADAAASSLLVEPVLPAGIEGTARARVWNLDSGIGTTVPEPAAGKPCRLANLAAGWYHVELHHATTGWFDAGRHWVDGKADCSLGQVLLPAPGKVAFALDALTLPPEDQQASEVCRLRGDLDIRCETNGPAPASELLLPAGDYVFAWKDKAGAVQFHRFAVQSGRELIVRPGT